MKVKELINKLSECDPEMHIEIVNDYYSDRVKLLCISKGHTRLLDRKIVEIHIDGLSGT